MDPITAAISIAGLGISLFSSVKEAGISSQETALSQQNTQLQIQENAQRQLAMQISARRQQTQDVRTAQMTASRNLATGVGQTGGTSSSGVVAGQQGATSGGDFNLQGVNQNLQIGNTLFGLQNQQSQNQIAMAGLQGQMNNWKGIGAIGGSLSGSAGPLGNILGNFFNNQSDPSAVLPGGPALGQGGIGHA